MEVKMLKDDIEELKNAMLGVIMAKSLEAERLVKIIRRLGFAQAREVLADFAIILETKDCVHTVRRDWEMFLGQD